MNQKKYNIAVVGATGAVGNEMVKVLENRNFPIAKLKLLASEKSIGNTIKFCDKDIPIELLSSQAFEGVDIALFSAGGQISLEYAPIAVSKGAIVIDNSSVFRMDNDIPLVVPEVNPDKISNFSNKGIIANPNCSTIQLVVVLSPLHKMYGIKRVVISTYQSISGAGVSAMEEMSNQTIALFSNKELKVNILQHRIAFNLIPHIGSFLEDGYTDEEAKLVNETKKILGDQSILVSPTVVRVPVFYSHSESVNIELHKSASVKDITSLLKGSLGIKLVDNPDQNEYPMPVNAAGTDEVYVGRIRLDSTAKNAFNMWIVADNIRKGAALNAVQIAEVLVDKYL